MSREYTEWTRAGCWQGQAARWRADLGRREAHALLLPDAQERPRGDHARRRGGLLALRLNNQFGLWRRSEKERL